MTHALANPMATDAGNMVVTCSPLHRREELLDRRQMGETLGGNWVRIAIEVGKQVLTYITGVVTGVTVAEVTSNNNKKPSNHQSCCSCCCCKR